MFYYMPSQPLLFEIEVIAYSYSRNWGIKENAKVKKYLNN